MSKKENSEERLNSTTVVILSSAMTFAILTLLGGLKILWSLLFTP